MQPHDKLAEAYSLDALTSSAIRETVARDALQALEQLFTGSEPPIPIPNALGHAFGFDLTNLVAGKTLGVIGDWPGELISTEVYESFDYNGITFESKIFRLATAIPEENHKNTGYVQKKVYFVGLTARDSNIPDIENLRYGVIENPSGERKFFELEINPNQGELTTVAAITDDDRVLAEEKRRDQKSFNVKPMDPDIEYLVVEEFRKAITHRQPSS